MPTTPPLRRWFRYGLRTMFVVVALIALPLGWEMNRIHDRNETIAKIRQLGGMAFRYAERGPDGRTRPVYHCPLWRRWMGDESWRMIEMPLIDRMNDAELERVRRLFPEAERVERRYPATHS